MLSLCVAFWHHFVYIVYNFCHFQKNSAINGKCYDDTRRFGVHYGICCYTHNTIFGYKLSEFSRWSSVNA